MGIHFTTLFNRLPDSGVHNPATRLIRNAVRDEQLLRQVLPGEFTPEDQLPECAANQLNA